MIKLLLSLFSLFLVRLASAQTDSTQAKTLALQKEYQQLLKKYEDFQAIHGHSVQTPNTTMHYLAWGKPTGHPLVWAHGLGSNGYEFASFADSLAKKGFYVLAIDYYGHGKTPIPTKEVSVYNVADDIAYLLKKLNIQKTIIGGWSGGGVITAAFYELYPSMVTGIILEDGGSVCLAKQFFRLGPADMMKKITEMYEKSPPEVVSFTSKFDAFRHYQADGTLSLFNGALGLLTVHSLNQSPSGQWSSNPNLGKLLGDDSLQSYLRIITRPTEGALFLQSLLFFEPKIAFRNVGVPVLIYDPVDKVDLKDFEVDNRRLTQQHPHWITHLVYEDTGHAVKLQRPARFYTDLSKFLAQIEAPKK